MLRKKKKRTKNQTNLQLQSQSPSGPVVQSKNLASGRPASALRIWLCHPSRNHIQTGDVTRPCHCSACSHREVVQLLLVSLRCPSPSQLQHQIMPWTHPSQRAGERVPAKTLLRSLLRDQKTLLTAPQLLGAAGERQPMH